MTKKKVSLNRSGDLTSVDAELDSAMERLSDANLRITTLLEQAEAQGRSHDTQASDPDSDASASDDASTEQDTAQ